MEIFNQDSGKTEAVKEEKSPRSFFPRRDMNDLLPLWEKLVFFFADFLGLNVISIFVSLLVIAFGRFSIETAGSDPLANSLVNFFSYLIIFVIYMLMIFLIKRKTYKPLFKGFADKKIYLYALGGLLAIFAVEQLLGLLYQKTVPFYSSNENQTTIVKMMQSYPALVFFPTVLFAPFVEELAYRVGLVDTIGHKDKNTWLGIILASIIFGLIHTSLTSITDYLTISASSEASAATIESAYQTMVNEFLNLPIYLIDGFIMAFVYVKSGKIAASITLHVSNNLLSFIILLAQSLSATSGNSTSLLNMWVHFL